MTINGKTLADLLQVSPQRVSNLKRAGTIIPTSKGEYDLNDQTNRAFLREHFRREYLQSQKGADKTDGSEESLVELERQELEEKIRYTRERADERALMNAARRKDLFHRDLVLEYFSGFASGLRTYILPIPGRVAPRVEAALKTGNGDAVEIMEAEIKDGIERAVSLGKEALHHARETIEEDADDDEEI